MHDKRARSAFMRVERVCAELRRGGLAMLRLNNGEAALFRGAEFADNDNVRALSQLARSGPLLALTANRVKSFGRSIREGWPAATIALSLNHCDRIFELAFDHTTLSDDDDLSIIAEQSQSLADYATKLLRHAKLLPAALLGRLPIRDIAAQDRFVNELNILTVEARDLESLRETSDFVLREAARARVPLEMAEDAQVVMFRTDGGGEDHFAVLIGKATDTEEPLVRLHSQCITGDVLGSLKCDCGDQLRGALHLMAEKGGGVLVYLAQEGRNIGLMNKLRAYALQDGGLDTVDANHALGFDTDERVFSPAARILKALGVSRLRLITNNPEKINQLEQFGLCITERVPLALSYNRYNRDYLDTKRKRTGHFIAGPEGENS